MEMSEKGPLVKVRMGAVWLVVRWEDRLRRLILYELR